MVAVGTNAKQEDRAYNNLHTWGVECFNPKIKEYRRNQFTGIATQMPNRYSRDISLRALTSLVRFTKLAFLAEFNEWLVLTKSHTH